MATFTIDPEATIGGLHLKVSDIVNARRFYEGLLGFRATEDDRGILHLRAGDGVPVLLVSERPRALPSPPRTTGLYHFAVRLPSREALARFLWHAQQIGLRLQGAADHGVSEALYLDDPDGNGMEIYADRPRETWRTQGHRLEMRTVPLNVDRLIATIVDGAPSWDGLPDGTDIGHVHLKVADLPETERFYCDGLGFTLQMRYGDSALFMSAGGYHHHIGANTWSGRGAPPPPEDAVGMRYFVLHLSDQTALEALHDHLVETGIDVVEDGYVYWVTDPSGNRIAFTTPDHLPVRSDAPVGRLPR